MPHPHAAEDLVRRKRNIESGRGPSGIRMMNRGGRVGLVRGLVARETKVAIDPKHRTAARARIGDVIAAQLVEPWTEIGNKRKHRVAHLGFVAILVALKPFTIIVAAEFLKELKEARGEITFGHRLTSRIA